jgi:FKBP-type peptidyl-prolyl cis-trans isomerase FkpA
MNRTIALVALLLCAACPRGGGAPGAGPAPQTEEQKTLYALGLVIGRNLESFQLKPEDLQYVQKGIADKAQGKPTDVKIEEYLPKIQQLQMSRAQARAGKEKERGQAFADKLAHEPGAQKLPSGLVFRSVKEGTGASPGPTDRVKVHYHGTLEDGTVFDSSKQRGQPAEFALNGVIPCWTEAVQKMKVGGEAKIACPSNIAYGDMGRPPKIPGGATLVFDVELLGIEPPGAAGALPPGHPPAGQSRPIVLPPTGAKK